MTFSLPKYPTIAIRVVAVAIVLASLATGLLPGTVHAANLANFNPGRIIDDGVFTNYESMSAAQIQAFLNSKVPVCDTNGTQASEYGGGTRAQWGAAHNHPTPFTCLKDYVENNASAAQIIYVTAQQYRINPQVLIVLLQKEQGLVTDTWPVNSQYKTATGYGCPDTAPCDTQYFGLANQLNWSAKMFRAIIDNSPTWYTPYLLGDNTIQWNPQRSCGGSTVTIQNRATQALYNYTPYQPNKAALSAGYGSGDSCSSYGNRNFYQYFTDWFGSTMLPVAIKSADSPAVYVQTGLYKFAVPSMALLQDYGISPSTVSTLSPSLVDGIPNAPVSSGLSSSIGYIVKSESDSDADSGTVYFVSLGRRYSVQSMQQFNDYGFRTGDITYLPYSYLMSLKDGGGLSQFIATPTNNVFKVAGAQKQIIFSYDQYKALNPDGGSSSVSMAAAAYIPSGNPISSTPVLIKLSNSAVYAFSNGSYYAVPSLDVFRCWGFDGPQGIGLNSLADDSFISVGASTPLGCSVKTTTGKTLVLNGSNAYVASDSTGLNPLTLDASLSTLASKLDSSKNLSTLVKAKNSDAVWYLENGKKRLIPSYQNLLMLGYPQTDLNVIDSGSVAAIATGPIKLAQGKTVKSDTSDTIYLISGNGRTAFDSPEAFIAYGYRWSDIETYPAATLDAAYPSNSLNVGRFLSGATNANYLIDGYGCKVVSDAVLSAYGQTKSALPSFSKQSYPYLAVSDCPGLSTYVKSPGGPVVYAVTNGVKQPVSSWSKLLQISNQSPVISTVSDSTLAQLTTGPTL